MKFENLPILFIFFEKMYPKCGALAVSAVFFKVSPKSSKEAFTIKFEGMTHLF